MKTAELKLEIIRLLRQHARRSEKEIGDRLNVAPEKVAALIREMEADGTIVGYYTLVDDGKVAGAPVRAIIEVQVQPQRDGGFDNVATMLSKFPEVRGVQLLSGSYDLSLEVQGESLQDVANFVASKLAQLQGVTSTRTHFLLKKYKEAGIMLHKDEQHERLKIVP